jgi:LacI family repressor for deo operon, udp, cdd, tsx, nupC, and nupG
MDSYVKTFLSKVVKYRIVPGLGRHSYDFGGDPMGRGDKATVADVARAAGVSPATVSRVLHHPELVNGETLERVRRSISDLDYSSVSFDGIGASGTPLIVISIPWLDNPFYGEIVRGARVAAQIHGAQILISWGNPEDPSLDDFCQMLRSCGAQGIITCGPLSLEALGQIDDTVPVVQCCEFNDRSSVPYVSIDDFSAARTATEHLLSCGCRRLAFVGGPDVYKYTRERRRGFLSMVGEQMIEVPDRWVLQIPNNSFGLAYSAVCHMLESEERPDGVFACSDTFASAVIRSARKSSLEVPGDLMVVGFDNTDTAVMTTPTITTINQPRYNMGFSACNLLFERIEGSSEATSMTLETELVVRESTTSKKELS